MKIWHIGGQASPHMLGAVNYVIWQVARGQALLRHQVALIVETPPSKDSLSFAEQIGLELIHIPASAWRYDPKVLRTLLRTEPPQMVHMHSVFLPKQAVLARTLARSNIPYMITPHGLSTQLFQRGRVKKSVYSWLVEKPRFYTASAISVLTPMEAKAVRAFVPHFRGVIRWIPNPVDEGSLGALSWKGGIGTKRLVFLGRFDVLCKGIDILLEIARFLPNVEVHLYGMEDPRTSGWLERLKRNLPPNVYFHSPVFGVEKARVLADASLYIQTSRWEGFPISIAEAMCLGVPCAIAETINLAELFRQYDLGLVLPQNAEEAATRLSEGLNQPTQLRHWSERAQAFAREHLHPRTVASSYLKLYEEVIHD